MARYRQSTRPKVIWGCRHLQFGPGRALPIRKEDDLPIVREQHGAIAENFRTLRTALHLLDPPKERRIFLFTSAVPGEGKSFCAASLALAFAQQGLRTLLIDADMRRPALHALFTDNPPAVGVADVLLGTGHAGGCRVPANEKMLSVLSAGHRPRHPAELLAGPQFAQLLLRSRRKLRSHRCRYRARECGERHAAPGAWSG